MTRGRGRGGDITLYDCGGGGMPRGEGAGWRWEMLARKERKGKEGI